jgi:hypothetical protein
MKLKLGDIVKVKEDFLKLPDLFKEENKTPYLRTGFYKNSLWKIVGSIDPWENYQIEWVDPNPINVSPRQTKNIAAFRVPFVEKVRLADLEVYFEIVEKT